MSVQFKVGVRVMLALVVVLGMFFITAGTTSAKASLVDNHRFEQDLV